MAHNQRRGVMCTLVMPVIICIRCKGVGLAASGDVSFSPAANECSSQSLLQSHIVNLNGLSMHNSIAD